MDDDPYSYSQRILGTPIPPAPSPPPVDYLTWYRRIKAAVDASPFRKKKECVRHARDIVLRVLAGRKPNDDILLGLIAFAYGTFEAERIYYPYVVQPQGYPENILPALYRNAEKLVDPSRIERQEQYIVTALEHIIAYFPSLAYSHSPTAPRVPLHELISDLPHLINDAYALLSEVDADEEFYFASSWGQYDKNVIANSPKYKGTHSNELVLPTESELTGDSLINAYCAQLPLEELLTSTCPLEIPERIRAEHQWIIAGSGHGKTQTLQHQIWNDLNQPNPPAMIIIDPKGSMIEHIQQLDLFSPDTGKLKDRLVIFDPNEVHRGYVPALNFFDAGARRNSIYSAAVRRQIENTTLDLFAYIFDSQDQKLTPKQRTVFQYLAPLLLQIPGANIHTLMAMLRPEDDGSQWRPFIEQQNDITRDFFEQSYYNKVTKEYQSTKSETRTRISTILTPSKTELRMMLSTRTLRVDLFDILQNRKILLINTSYGTLGREQSTLLGRIFIALTVAAIMGRTALSRSEWHPAFLYIDEFQLYADEDKTQEMLQLVREYNLGVVMAHQKMKDLSEVLQSTVSGNTSTKMAGGVTSHDINFLARDLDCHPDLIKRQEKLKVQGKHTSFATYIRGLTPTPITMRVPFLTLENAPKMSNDAHRKLIERNRASVCVPVADLNMRADPIPPAPVTTVSEPSTIPKVTLTKRSTTSRTETTTNESTVTVENPTENILRTIAVHSANTLPSPIPTEDDDEGTWGSKR